MQQVNNAHAISQNSAEYLRHAKSSQVNEVMDKIIPKNILREY